MTVASPIAEAAASGSLVRRLGANPVLLFAAFILVHLVVGLLNLFAPGNPLGDVSSVYKFWVDQVVTADFWVGVDSSWVYPIGAIVPMLAAYALYPIAEAIPGSGVTAASWQLYTSSWLALVLLLDLAALGVLTGWGRRRDRLAAGWWWTAFIAALGPIAMGRIDAVSVAVAMVGVVLIARSPRAAALVLTIAAWIKVWPGALVIAMVVAGRERWRVIVTAIAVTAAIAGFALSFGAGTNVLSFVTEQGARGLQAEAPISTYWMWRAASDVDDTRVYFDQTLLTWQITGPGSPQASALMTPLLLLVVVAVVLVALLARRDGASPDALLAPTALALVSALIAFQKVGSPQFVSWLAVPVVLGLLMHRAGRGAPFRLPAVITVVIALATHAFYPYLYGYLLGLWPVMLTALTVRNVLYFVLLGVALHGIRTASRWNADVAAEALTTGVKRTERGAHTLR